jgi:hypothetical protein
MILEALATAPAPVIFAIVDRKKDMIIAGGIGHGA